MTKHANVRLHLLRSKCPVDVVDDSNQPGCARHRDAAPNRAADAHIPALKRLFPKACPDSRVSSECPNRPVAHGYSTDRRSARRAARRASGAQLGDARAGEIVTVGAAPRHRHRQRKGRTADERAGAGREGTVGRLQAQTVGGAPARDRRGWCLRTCKPPIPGRDDIGVDLRRAPKLSAQPNNR
jgi:hypothetical protein